MGSSIILFCLTDLFHPKYVFFAAEKANFRVLAADSCYISVELVEDKQFWLAAAKVNVHVLLYAFEDWLADNEFCLAAVTQNGLALKYVSAELRANKEFCFA